MKATRPFHFKQFSIRQSQTAMKVTLDACLFGALVAQQSTATAACRALDIGAGTGLLSLMLAQTLPCRVDGVEIDADAAREANSNIEESPFSERVQVSNSAIEHFSPTARYDLIISNPPFFTDGLKGPDKQRNQARHNDGLSFETLCTSIIELLSENGSAWLLLPVEEMTRLKAVAASLGLNAHQEWLIASKADQASYRAITRFSKVSCCAYESQKIVVRTATNDYSDTFKALLAPYYLKL